MEPISFGVINGILGSLLTGQSVRDEAKKKAADDKAAVLKSGMETLTTSLNSSPEAAFNFMNNGAMFPIFQSLDPYRQASILNTAGRSFETASQKNWLAAAKDDPTIARSLLSDNRLLEQPDFQAIVPILVGYASPTFGKQEFEIIKDVAGDYDKAQPILQSGMFPKGSPVHAVLSSIQQPNAEYTPITVESFTQIKNAFKDGEGATALALITGLEQTVSPFAKTSQAALRDQLKLTAYKTAYGSENDDVDTVGEFLDKAIDSINQLDDAAARQVAAKTNIPIVNELANGLPVKQWSPDARAAMARLVAIAGIANETDKNRTVYKNAAGEDVFSLQTEKSLMDDPDGWLDTLNRYPTESIAAAYKAMSTTYSHKSGLSC